MPSAGLEEFKRVAKDFTDLGALALKFAVATPLIGIVVKLGPPPVRTISALTCLFEFIALISTFHFWSSLKAEQQNIRMKAALLCFCLGLIASLIGIERFTISPGPGRDRVVKGYTLRPPLDQLIGPAFSEDDALRAAEFDPAKVWTESSVTVVHVSLIMCWLATFSSLAIFLSLFVMAHKGKRQTSRKASPSKAAS